MITAFFKDSLVYLIPNLLSRGIGFFMLPIYTRFLSPSEYGFVDLLTALYVILSFVLPLEVSQGVSRLLVDEEKVTEKSSLVSTAFWFTFLAFSLFGAFAITFPQVIDGILVGDGRHLAAIRIAGISMPLNALFYAMQNQLRWSLASKSVSAIVLLFTLVNAGVSGALLVFFGGGVESIVIGQGVGSLCGILAGIYLARSYVPLIFAFKVNQLKELLAFSVPLVFSSSAYYGATYIDRWMLKSLMSVESVGVYGVALKVGGMVGIIIYAAQMALSPLIYNHYKEAGTAAKVDKIFGYFILLSLSILCTLGIVADPLIRIMTDEAFYSASGLVVILGAATIFSGAYVFTPGLSLAKKTKMIALINIVVLVQNVTLNYFMIPSFGRTGAALSTLFGGIVMFLLYSILSRPHFRVPFRVGRYILSCFVACVFLYLISLWSNWLITTMLYIVCLCSFMFLLVQWDDLRRGLSSFE